MYVIVGLGNPGDKYARTRHNVGFDVVELLAGRLGVSFNKLKCKARLAEGRIGNERVVLAQPQTFMNLSGQSVVELVSWYKIDMDHLIVVYDDIDLEPGQLRIRKQGSAGGHNGMKDIIQKLGTEKFIRIRIGVGAKPQGWDLAAHVLSRFTPADRKLVDEAIEEAICAVEELTANGVDAAMNRYNRKKKL